MALTLRLTKGSPLSHQELDDNFTYLSGSLTDSNTLLSGSFPADRLIVSADSASATAGGVTTNSQLRTYDGNTSILIGGSQGSFGVTGLGMLIKEDEGSGDHVILSDGSGSNLRLRAGGGDVGDSYVMIQADQAGFSDDDIFVVAKFGGPNKGTELYHSGSLVFFTDELSGDKSVYISGSLSGSKDVFFPALPNTTTPHIVGFDSASGQLTYYSTASFGGGSSTDTGSLMLTGSVSNNTLTFTKGDGSTFSLTVDTGSGAGGGSTDTGSLMLTGSVTNNVLTFTKGDGTTFDLTVDTGSAPSLTLQEVVDTGNISTTDIELTGSLDITGSINAVGQSTFTSVNSLASPLIVEPATGSPYGALFMRADSTTGAIAQFHQSLLSINSSHTLGSLKFTQFTNTWGQIKVQATNTSQKSVISLTANGTSTPHIEIDGETDEVTINNKVLAPSLANTSKPNVVGYDTATGELTYYSTGSFGGTVNTGSFVYSGSYNSAASTITLYSADNNYTLDLSGLAGGGGGFPITASNEGSDLTNSMSKIDFVGNAVEATNVGSIVTVTINTGSAASATDITDLNNFTGSIQTEVDSLTAATSSYLTGADTGSFYISSSVVDNTITFTQGDGTTESVTVDTGSATDITALNNFTGSIQTEVDSLTAATSSYLTGADTGSFYIASSVSNDTITFTQGDGTTEEVIVDNVRNTTSASYAATASYAYETDLTFATDSTSQTTTRVVHVAGTANAVNGTSSTTSPVMSVLSGKTLGTDAFFTATWIDNSVAGQQGRPIAIETISGSNQLVFTVDTMNADVTDAIMFQGIVLV